MVTAFVSWRPALSSPTAVKVLLPSVRLNPSLENVLSMFPADAPAQMPRCRRSVISHKKGRSFWLRRLHESLQSIHDFVGSRGVHFHSYLSRFNWCSYYSRHQQIRPDDD